MDAPESDRPADPPSRRTSVTWGVVKTEDEGDGDSHSLAESHTLELSTEDDDAQANTKQSQSKKRRLTFPKLFFPGLRKDSIAIYKAKKLLASPEDLNTPNGDSGFGAEEDDYQRDDEDTDHEELPAITLPRHTLSPSSSILKRRSSKLRMDMPVKESFFTVLSGMYAMILVTLGGVMPIAEVFAEEEDAIFFEIFYLYIYGVSILFLGYVYIYLLGNRKISITGLLRRTDSTSSQKKRTKKRKVSVDEVDSHTGSFYLRLGALAFGIGGMIHNGLQFGRYFDDSCQSAIYAVRPILHLIFTFVQLYFVFMNSKMCINRYKAIARFGLMHMVATNICVWLDTIVTETLHQSHASTHGSHDSHPDSAGHHNSGGIHGDGGHHGSGGHGTGHDSIATDLHNRSVHYNEHMSDHVIHTVTTSIASFLNESMHIADKPQHTEHLDPVQTMTTGHPLPTHPPHHCPSQNLMSTIVETAGPYLYPCTIEYSLICAGILYTLWGNIGKRVMRYQPEDGEQEGTKQQRLSVDCSNSSRGLFLGIITMVGTVITMVMFFVLIERQSHYQSGILVEHLTEIFLYIFSAAAVLVAAYRMRYLMFNSTRDTDFEEILLIISLGGEFMFDLLSVIAAMFEKSVYGSGLNIVAKIFGMLQASMQTIFVLNGLRRSGRTPEQIRRKMGREFVTFLLISNISMWGVNTFALQRSEANPVQLHFYGALSWNILTHISIPLAIFFRFHSTVCLSNVWKRAWKGHH